MATHSSILAWEIPWTEEPDGLQCMGSLSTHAKDNLQLYIARWIQGSFHEWDPYLVYGSKEIQKVYKSNCRARIGINSVPVPTNYDTQVLKPWLCLQRVGQLVQSRQRQERGCRLAQWICNTQTSVPLSWLQWLSIHWLRRQHSQAPTLGYPSSTGEKCSQVDKGLISIQGLTTMEP